MNGIAIVFRDISDRVRRDRWQRSKEEIFHAITTHKPLEETLRHLAEAYTAFQPNCSIAVLLRTGESGGSLSLLASSGVSTALKAKLQLIPIDENTSVCGRAAFLQQHPRSSPTAPWKRCLRQLVRPSSGALLSP